MITEPTKEEKAKLIQACKLVKEVYPDMNGNIQFNLCGERVKVNMNVGFSVIIQPEEYFAKNKDG